jgi:adenosine deaminase
MEKMSLQTDSMAYGEINLEKEYSFKALEEK